MSSSQSPADLDWLLARADEARAPQAFARSLLEHLAARLGATVAILSIEEQDGRLHHFASSEAAADELDEVCALLEDPGAVHPDGVFTYRFNLRHTAGALYLRPVPSARVVEAEEAADAGVKLLGLLAELADARDEAAHDPLTGLLNRRSMREGLGRAIAQGNRYSNRTFSIAMLDLNNFKWFNDTYGHPVGDELLQQLARVLSKSVRSADLVARWGGDEFLLLCPQTEAEQVEVLLARVRSELDRYLQRYEREDLGLSAGIGSFPEDGRSSDDLIRRADERLYRAKQQP